MNYGDDIIPSHLNITPREERFYDGNVFDDVSLHWGEVQNIIYPDSPASRTKQFIEYTVFCQYMNDKVGNGRMYNNCLLVNPLGGLADKLSFTLRGEDSASKNDNNRIGQGSKVLILCVDGSTVQPVIIGGLRDPDDSEDKEAKDLGHHLDFLFNGIRVFIDKEGQLIITYGGKTTIDGERDDNVQESSTGTQASFLKDGSWQVTTYDGDNQEQYVLLDHANKKIIQQAKELWRAKAKRFELDHEEGVKIGTGSNKMLLASTYRQKETEMLNGIKQAHIQMAQKWAILAGLYQAIGTAHKVPITGPVAAAASFDTAAQIAQQLVQDCRKVVEDITKFEAQAKNYLSRKNTND